MEPISETPNVTLDNHVDKEIAGCLNLEAPRSFFLFAGAGSGKTRSLVNALEHVQEAYGARLRLRGQQVGVITYTNAACEEIRRRIRFDPLFHISTIHSFAWNLIGGFNIDIREWLRQDLAQNIRDIQVEETRGRAGTKASITRQAQVESKRQRLERLNEIKTFTYNPTGDNKEKNSLNHAEIIKICASFLSQKPLMQRILVNQFPILLIDESQDTNKHLIDAFLRVEVTHRSRFSLGLIGDTMQRIYGDGKDKIERELPAEWSKPEKKLNHRCPKRIVRLINQIRREVDDHVQVPRSDSIEGCVRLFVFPLNTPDKSTIEEAMRGHMAEIAEDDEWNIKEKCKILTLEHHMAAKRFGFQNIFDPLYAVEAFRTGLLDGTFPAIRLFTQNVLPLVTAQQQGDKFAAARIVRNLSPLLSKPRLKAAAEPRQQLKIAQDAVTDLMSLWIEGEPTCGAVLENIAASHLFLIPDILRPLLKPIQQILSWRRSLRWRAF
jgi:DNA helicase-2/ATP-dependent DNA helicase PcrA